jgi:hypothetical protein
MEAMDKRGLLPVDLLATALWRDMARLPRDTREPLALALVLSWDTRDSEPLAWSRVWRAAREAART